MRCSRLTRSEATMADEQGYVDLRLTCVEIYKALKQGMGEPSNLVCEAIDKLTMWVAW